MSWGPLGGFQCRHFSLGQRLTLAPTLPLPSPAATLVLMSTLASRLCLLRDTSPAPRTLVISSSVSNAS